MVGSAVFTNSAKIIGHGEVAGRNGSINPELSTLSTALTLIDKAGLSIFPDGFLCVE
ncbi:MAG: hypothetical protein OEX03_00405 [Gammaproteobacteria bacterium]|nr:hypothetical protein [Gammaproteobacteria bacterium]